MKIDEQYFIKGNLPREFNDSLTRMDFQNSFNSISKQFLNENKRFFKKTGIIARRDNDIAIYIIENKNNKLYDGKLWDDEDISMIGNMDYMYSLPMWDWWIDPIFDANKYRVEKLHHVLGKYGKTVIFVKNNKIRNKEFKKIITSEGFKVIRCTKLYEKNPLELFLFYDYYTIYIPFMLAKEIWRIQEDIDKKSPKMIYFLLRGGYFISEFIKYPKSMRKIVPPGMCPKADNTYIVDDCIVMGRCISKIWLKRTSKFNFSVLNSVLPEEFYSKEFSNAKLNFPKNYLNIFSCRFFEKNPFLMGIDYNGGSWIHYSSNVRNKIILLIKENMKKVSLKKITDEMGRDLMNYSSKGYQNKHFEELKIISEQNP